MTGKEFKAWFEGFCEGVGDVPTKEQFEKIKAKVNQLDDYPKLAYRPGGAVGGIPQWSTPQVDFPTRTIS